MLKRILYCLILSYQLLLTGCASTSNFLGISTIDQLIDSHQYQKALTKIQSQKPINQALLLQVTARAEKQHKKQIYKIDNLIKQKKWGEAKSVLNTLKNNQPNLISLPALHIKIDKYQNEEDRLLKTKRALLEADLLNVQLLQQDLSERILYDEVNWLSNTDNLIIKKHTLADKLLHLSTQALLVKDYYNAQKTYEKATDLDRKLTANEITDAINTGLSQQNNAAIDERKKSLIRQLYLAIDKKNIEQILKIEKILSNKIFKGSEVDKALAKAEKFCLKSMKHLDERAATEYRKGHVSAAVNLWQQALKLRPDNIDLQEKLIRAKKVHNKLIKIHKSEE